MSPPTKLKQQQEDAEHINGDFFPEEPLREHRARPKPSPEQLDARTDKTDELGQVYRQSVESQGLKDGDEDMVRLISNEVDQQTGIHVQTRNTDERRHVLQKEIQPALEKAHGEEKAELIQQKSEIIIEQAYTDVFLFHDRVLAKLRTVLDDIQDICLYSDAVEDIDNLHTSIKNFKSVVTNFEIYTTSAGQLISDYARTYRNDAANTFLAHMNTRMYLALSISSDKVPPAHIDQTYILGDLATRYAKSISFDQLDELLATKRALLELEKKQSATPDDKQRMQEQVAAQTTQVIEQFEEVTTIEVAEVSETTESYNY